MSESGRPSPQPKILIIDGDELTATELQVGLLGAGYAVRQTPSAEAALGSLATAPADLILMELMLPDADGLVLCSLLRTTLTAPILLLSGRPSEVDRAMAIQSGAVDLLAKPVNLPFLLGRLRGIVPPAVGDNAISQETAV